MYMEQIQLPADVGYLLSMPSYIHFLGVSHKISH